MYEKKVMALLLGMTLCLFGIKKFMAPLLGMALCLFGMKKLWLFY